jgi:hypothetical protein
MEKVKNRGVEKRKFYRLDSAVQVRVTIPAEDEDLCSPKSFIAKSKNISLEGICLETRQVEIDGVHILTGSPGSLKNRLDMEIDLYPSEKTFKVKGEVCWYDLSKETEEFIFEVGIVFINMDAAAKETLKKFISSQKSRGKGFFKSLFNKLRT